MYCPSSRSDLSLKSSPIEPINQLPGVGDGRKRASTLSLASAVPRRLLENSDVTSAESSDEEFECLGSGFINLNLSETGRDVRVLVRSKQTKARAAGGSLLDYDHILNELLVEEPALFQDTDDQYHRRLVRPFRSSMTIYSLCCSHRLCIRATHHSS